MTRLRPPPREAALAQYRRRARTYDLELAAFEPVRRRAVQALALVPGDTVLDVAWRRRSGRAGTSSASSRARR